MIKADKPSDSGLQAERTSLAWIRTTLALAVTLLVTARLLAHELSPLALAVGGGGIAFCLGILAVGHLRYRRTHALLSSEGGERAPFHSGLPLFAWSCSVVLAGIVGLGVAVTRTMSG